jgi:hypothetical protein
MSSVTWGVLLPAPCCSLPICHHPVLLLHAVGCSGPSPLPLHSREREREDLQHPRCSRRIAGAQRGVLHAVLHRRSEERPCSVRAEPRKGNHPTSQFFSFVMQAYVFCRACFWCCFCSSLTVSGLSDSGFNEGDSCIVDQSAFGVPLL